MSDIVKQLREARPTLRVVSPLSHWIVILLAIFNLFLGASLFVAFDSPRFSSSLLIVNDFLTFKFWGVVFILIGLLKLYSIKINDWSLSRRSLLIGVAVKAVWAVALTIRTFVSPGTLFLNLLWLTVAAIQMACYIYFMPPSTSNYNQRRIDRD